MTREIKPIYTKDGFYVRPVVPGDLRPRPSPSGEQKPLSARQERQTRGYRSK